MAADASAGVNLSREAARKQFDVFYGALEGDDDALRESGDLAAVQALRHKADAAVARGRYGTHDFVEAAHEALRWMEGLPREHFLH